MRSSKIIALAFVAACTVSAFPFSAYAGSLSPASSPAAFGYTLSDIFTRLTTNASSTAGAHSFNATTTPASTFPTLIDIYNSIPTINPAKLLSDTTYLGVTGSIAINSGDNTAVSSATSTNKLLLTPPTGYYNGSTVTVSTSSPNFIAVNIANGINFFGIIGTLLGNMWNGSNASSTFPGGSQMAGGVDDYNNAGSPPIDRYATGWTACISGNSYCGTGDAGAAEKDNSTDMIWSLPCDGTGCSSFSNTLPLTYSWSNSAANNSSSTASQLCSNHAGWSLPDQKQLMQAYIDGSYGNLEASGIDHSYWAASTVSNVTTFAWTIDLSLGFARSNTKASNSNVRCVWPGN